MPDSQLRVQLAADDGLTPAIQRVQAMYGQLDARGQATLTNLANRTNQYAAAIENSTEKLRILEHAQELASQAGNFEKAAALELRQVALEDQLINRQVQLADARQKTAVADVAAAERKAVRDRQAIMDANRLAAAADVSAQRQARADAATALAETRRERTAATAALTAQRQVATTAQQERAELQLANAAELAGVKLATANSNAETAAIRAEKAELQLASAVERADRQTKGWGDTLKGVFGGMVLQRIFFDVANGVKQAGEEVVSATADQQQALITYTALLHNVGAAQKELETVKVGATEVPQALGDVIKLDQNLITRFQTFAGVQTELGRTLPQTRQDILDVGAAFSLSGDNLAALTKDLQDLAAGQNVGLALRSMAQLTGTTREELTKLGVEFDKSGKTLVSSSHAAATAVLQDWEDKFSGLAAIQSHTFNGMKQNAGDLAGLFASKLGGQGIAVATTYLSRWIDAAAHSPEVQHNLEVWGDRIGRITEKLFEVIEAAGRGIGVVANFLSPVVKIIDNLLSLNTVVLPNTTDLFARAAKVGADASTSFDSMADSTDSVATRQAALDAQLKAIDRDMQNLRYAAEQELIPLHDKETALDRIYQKTHQTTDLNKLNKEIARDTALSKDIFSSEGRAAGMRLEGEIAQRNNLQAEMAHDKEKQTIEDKVKGIERTRDTKIHADEMEKRRLQDAQDALKNSAKQIDAVTQVAKGLNSAVGSVWDKITAWGQSMVPTLSPGLSVLDQLKTKLDAATTGSDGLKTSFDQLTGMLGSLVPKLETTAQQLGLDKGLAATFAVARWAVKEFIGVSLAGLLPLLQLVGTTAESAGSQMSVFGAQVRLGFMRANPLMFNDEQRQAAEKDVLDQQTANKALNERQNKLLGMTWDDYVKRLGDITDANNKELQDTFNSIGGGQIRPGAQFGRVPDRTKDDTTFAPPAGQYGYGAPTTGHQYGTGQNAPKPAFPALPVYGPQVLPAPPSSNSTLTIVVTTDKGSVVQVVDAHLNDTRTTKRIMRNMGRAAQ